MADRILSLSRHHSFWIDPENSDLDNSCGTTLWVSRGELPGRMSVTLEDVARANASYSISLVLLGLLLKMVSNHKMHFWMLGLD